MVRGARKSGITHGKRARKNSRSLIRVVALPEDIWTWKTARAARLTRIAEAIRKNIWIRIGREQVDHRIGDEGVNR